jgi:hypothetical protein
MHQYDERYNYHLVKDGDEIGSSNYTSSLDEIRKADEEPGYHVAFVTDGYADYRRARYDAEVSEIIRHNDREIPRSEWAAKSAA